MYCLLEKRRTRLVASGIALGIAGLACADEVQVVGSTLGRFNLQAFAPVSNLLDLTYDHSTFDNTTVSGVLDLGGGPVPGTNVNNLGSFTLGNSDQDYNGNTFELFVTFTAPVTIAGGTSTVFTDRLFGTVLNGLGGVFIDFDNTPQTFNFSNASATGSFTMFVNDVSIFPGLSASLTGHFTGSQQAVPEPSILVALGCGGAGLLRRKRRRI